LDAFFGQTGFKVSKMFFSKRLKKVEKKLKKVASATSAQLLGKPHGLAGPHRPHANDTSAQSMR